MNKSQIIELILLKSMEEGKFPNTAREAIARIQSTHPEMKGDGGLITTIYESIKKNYTKETSETRIRELTGSRTLPVAKPTGIAVSKKVKQYEEQITRVGKYTTMPSFAPNTMSFDGGRIRQHYRELIEKKTLKDDPQLMEDIIEHRREILQHRITCSVDLQSGGRTVASLVVVGVLVENGQEIVNYWYGKKLEYFERQVEEFRATMARYRIKAVSVGTYPPEDKKYTVENVVTKFDFV
jgi:hypothetical protein